MIKLYVYTLVIKAKKKNKKETQNTKTNKKIFYLESLYLRASILKGKPGVDEMFLKRILEIFSRADA